MSSIDDRIVNMKFNNAQFERGIKETTNSLKDLQDGLQMDGAADGLSGLQSILSRFNLGPISDGVSHIADRISVFGAVGFTIIQNLTNGAIDVAKRLAGFVWDPLVEGGKRRALNIEQAKFQFRGLGVDVERAMSDALYAVQDTAFGLDEAAKAASQLSASQVALGDDMRTSLRGISGVAAMTNSSYEDIARIFTTVAGNGRLMGDQLNQISSKGLNAAATIAKAMGVTEAEVRKMVSEGEISFEIFASAMDEAFGENATKANETFSGSLANMRAALARIGAAVATTSFENQRDVFNALTPVINKVNKALTPLIELINEYTTISSKNAVSFLERLDLAPLTSAIPTVVRGIRNIVATVQQFLGIGAQAFREVFPMDLGRTVLEIATAFLTFSENFKMGSQMATNVGTAMRGFFSVLSIGWEVLKGIGSVIFRVFGAIGEALGPFLKLGGAMGLGAISAREFLVEGGGIERFFTVLGDILVQPVQMLAKFAGWLVEVVHGIRNLNFDWLTGGFDSLNDSMSPLERIGAVLVGTWEKVKEIFATLMRFMEPVFGAIGEFFKGFGKEVTSSLSTGDFSGVLAIINTGLLGGLVAMFATFFKGGLSGIFENILGGLGDGFFAPVKGIIDGVTEALSAMQTELKSKALLNIAIALAILTASIVALSLIDQEKLGFALAAMTVMFGQLFGALAVFEKVTSKVDATKLAGIAAGMILISISMAIMAAALSKLAENDWNELSRGLVGIGVILATFAGFAKLMEKSSVSMTAAGIGLVVISAALLVMASAVREFGEMDWDTLGIGLGVIAALLAMLAGFSQITANPAKILATALSIIIISTALKVLASALKSFGSMDLEAIGRGLVAMGGALAIIIVAVALLPTSMILTATSLIILGAALKVIASAMQDFGGMTWDEIGRGLTVMAGSLAILAGAMALMGIPIVLLGAVGIIAAAGALAVLAPAMVLLGTMEWDAIGRGLAVLASALAIIAVGGLLILPAVPALLALGAAAALIGVGMLAAGIGMTMFAAGLAALSVGGAAAAGVLILVVTGLINLIPMAMEAFANGVIAFANVIATSGTEITGAITTVIKSLIESIKETAPLVVETLFELIMMLVDTLLENVPQLVDSGLQLITGILEGIGSNIEGLVTAGLDIITNFIAGISNGIPGLIDEGINLVITFIESLADGIRDNTDRMNAAGSDLADAIVQGLISGLTSGVGNIVQAAKDVAGAALNAAKDFLGIASPSKEFKKLGEFSGQGFAIGLRGTKQQVQDSFNMLKQMLKDNMASSAQDIKNAEANLKKLRERQKDLSNTKNKDTDSYRRSVRDNAAAIKEEEKALANARKERKLAGDAYTELTKKLVKERDELKKLATQLETVNQKLAAADKQLVDAKQTRDDYRKSIGDEFSKLGDIDGETTLVDYMEDLKKQIADTQSFSRQIQKLRNLGLNDKMYKELLSKGITALPFITELIEGGEQSVKDLNGLSGQLDKTAEGLGKSASSELYQAGVDAAAGLVKGLQNERAAIVKEMNGIADEMVKAIKTKLGIKSPSRIFATIGKQSNEGLVKGLKQTSGYVSRAATDVGDAAISSLKKSLSNMSSVVATEMDVDPTIRPVLDLSALRKDASSMSTMFGSQNLDVRGTYKDASSIESARLARAAQEQEMYAPGSTTFVNFEQTNTSPKAISSAEVYRNTKNQLSIVKEAIKS